MTDKKELYSNTAEKAILGAILGYSDECLDSLVLPRWSAVSADQQLPAGGACGIADRGDNAGMKGIRRCRQG